VKALERTNKNKDVKKGKVPAYRRPATIVQLCKFGLTELDDLIKRHESQ